MINDGGMSGDGRLHCRMWRNSGSGDLALLKHRTIFWMASDGVRASMQHHLLTYISIHVDNMPYNSDPPSTASKLPSVKTHPFEKFTDGENY